MSGFHAGGARVSVAVCVLSIALIANTAAAESSPIDPVIRLGKQLDAGETTLEFSPGKWGYLPSLLQHLEVNIDSQVLVFSKTSFQADKIGPRHPRAIYFNDNVSVGYVHDGTVLELAVLDPAQRITFYTLDVHKSDHPRFERRERECTSCHGSGDQSHLVVDSTIPEADGTAFVVLGNVQPTPTDHRTPFDKRWGGWYVTGTHGSQKHMGNAVAPDIFHPFDLETKGTQNRTSLEDKFDTKDYPAATSDIVALMTLEHQTRMASLISTTSRLFRADEEIGGGGLSGRNRQALSNALDEMVKYMLFEDEIVLPEPVRGVSEFTRTFAERGPRDKQGRSLRDFDLRTRMFRYPLSFMIYSEFFDAMPQAAKDGVYRRLYDVLTGGSAKGDRLSGDERRAILEILRDTKPGLPEYWSKPPVAGI